MLDAPIDWLAWAGRLNQLSLLPFLAFLWTLWHTSTAPRGVVRGFSFYLAFIAVGIPAGLYCRQQLGTAMANVDWIHGPCEALLTTANLLIVMGLRDALRQQPPADGDSSSSSSSGGGDAADISRCSSGTSTVSQADGGRCNLPSHYSHTDPHSHTQPPASDLSTGADWESPPPLSLTGPHLTHSLAAEGPKQASSHQLPPLIDLGQRSPSDPVGQQPGHKRGPGIVRASSSSSSSGSRVGSGSSSSRSGRSSRLQRCIVRLALPARLGCRLAAAANGKWLAAGV